MTYFVESKCMTAGGYWDFTTLCCNEDGQKAWKQDFAQAYWAPMEFKTPLEALETIRELYRDNGQTYLLDENEQVVGVVDKHLFCLTDMKIKKSWD